MTTGTFYSAGDFSGVQDTELGKWLSCQILGICKLGVETEWVIYGGWSNSSCYVMVISTFKC